MVSGRTNGWSTGSTATRVQPPSPTSRWRPIRSEANMSSPGSGSETTASPSICGSSDPGGSVATTGPAPPPRSEAVHASRKVRPSGRRAHAFGPPKREPSPPARINPARPGLDAELPVTPTARNAKARRRKGATSHQMAHRTSTYRPLTTLRIPSTTLGRPKFTTIPSHRVRDAPRWLHRRQPS